MNRLALIVLTSLVLILGGTIAGHARVRSNWDLSQPEKKALAASKARVVVYDYALRDLDLAHQQHKIGSRAYASRYWQLVGFIGDEAAYQDAILVRESDSNHDPGSKVLATADKAWDDWGKYVIEAPAYLALVVLEGVARSGLSISP